MKSWSDQKSYTISLYKSLLLIYSSASDNCLQKCALAQKAQQQWSTSRRSFPPLLLCSNRLTFTHRSLLSPSCHPIFSGTSNQIKLRQYLGKKACQEGSIRQPSFQYTTSVFSKRHRSLVTPAASSVSTPSSSISRLSFSSAGSSKFGTNQAPLDDVLYGETSTLVVVASSLSKSNMGLRRLLIPEVLQLQENTKLVLVLSMTSHLLPLFKGAVLQDIRQANRSLLPSMS
jgi:hypothetical protein